MQAVMDAISTTPVLIAILVLLYLRSLDSWRARTRGRPLPPGPRPLPLIGNLLQIPRVKPWEGFRELSSTYGNIVHFRIPTQPPLVILGNAEYVKYLCRSWKITRDKLQSPLVELVGSDLNFAFYPYGPRWQLHRRAFQPHFVPEAIKKYRPIQVACARAFLRRLLNDPSRFKDHIRFTFAASLLKIIYNIDAADENDRYISAIDTALEGAAQGLAPGRYLVGFFPILRYVPAWFPGAGFQKDFARWREASLALKNMPFDHVKDEVLQGDNSSCIIGDALRSGMTQVGTPGKELSVEEKEDVMKNVGAVAIEGGSDTTFSTLQTVFLAMSLNPTVLQRAQAELDSVVGPNRLPNFDDRSSLVYVEAVIKEALRWQNVIPLGVPHRLTQDDVLGDYFLPEGTLLLPNIWACMHDPLEYGDPDVFRPERFIKDGQLNPNVRDPADFVFGFGQRKCAGRYFAEASLFINVASVLHVFDITPPLTKDGQPVTITPNMTDGLLS
ncbi:CyP450 monooxygenase [Earliella scabrosa]|nr:CyP450 monooxygenase [Earliella scabrosa]